jgi:hypothetical protein
VPERGGVTIGADPSQPLSVKAKRPQLAGAAHACLIGTDYTRAIELDPEIAAMTGQEGR